MSSSELYAVIFDQPTKAVNQDCKDNEILSASHILLCGRRFFSSTKCILEHMQHLVYREFVLKMYSPGKVFLLSLILLLRNIEMTKSASLRRGC